MVDKFIDMLSQRFQDENDLSDVTWALAHACPAFQRQFILFLFRDFPEGLVIKSFKREYSVGPARPDFYFQAGDREYIVESKIYDRYHHFDYIDYFPNAKFGNITNYHLPPLEGIEFRTWEAFRDHLFVALNAVELDGQSQALIKAYMRFLTNVCNISQLRKMNLNNLNSLYHLNILFRKILNTIPGYDIRVIDQWKSFHECKAGRWFNLNVGNRSISPYLGIFFKEEPYIYMEFDRNVNRVVYDAIDEANASEGIWFSKPEKDYESEMAVWFYLRPEHFDKFNAEPTTLEEQESILRAFVLEVLGYTSKYLTGDSAGK